MLVRIKFTDNVILPVIRKNMLTAWGVMWSIIFKQIKEDTLKLFTFKSFITSFHFVPKQSP